MRAGFIIITKNPPSRRVGVVIIIKAKNSPVIGTNALFTGTHPRVNAQTFGKVKCFSFIASFD